MIYWKVAKHFLEIQFMRKLFLLTVSFLFSCMLFAEQSNLIFRESYRLADVQNLVMALNSENVEIKNFRSYKVTIEAYSNNSSRSPIIKRSNKSIIIEHSKEHFSKHTLLHEPRPLTSASWGELWLKKWVKRSSSLPTSSLTTIAIAIAKPLSS